MCAAPRSAGSVRPIFWPDSKKFAGASNWTAYSQTQHCMSGADGACEIAAAPGEYAVVALSTRRVEMSDYEEEVRRLAATAPRVTLSLGEPKKLDLTLPAPR